MEYTLHSGNILNYDDLKDKIRGFDLILFRGGEFFSDMISALSEYKLDLGMYTHSGMIVTSEILPKYKDFVLVPGKLYILESTFSAPLPTALNDLLGMGNAGLDVISNKACFGVNLRDFEELIPRYIVNTKTKIAWFKLLNNPIDKYPAKKLQKKFKKVFANYYERSYELSFWNLLSSIFPELRPIRNLKDTVMTKILQLCQKESPAGWQFCSELTANIYRDMKILPKSIDPRNIIPVEFLTYPDLLDSPVYIADWDIENDKAVEYPIHLHQI